MDVLISSSKLLERLGHEELELKRLGLVNHAAGMRNAIVAVIKEVREASATGTPSATDSPSAHQ